MKQLPLFQPAAAWKPPRVADLPMNWNNFKRVGIDVETRDPELKKTGIGVRRQGYLVGISFAMDGQAFYLPIRHEGGDNMDESFVLEYVKAQLNAFQGELIGANINYDLDYLMEAGAVMRAVGRFNDVLLNEVLLNNDRFSYSLANVAKAHGLQSKDEAELKRAAQEYNVDPKSGLWELPARYVGEYAERDALLPLEIWDRQRPLLITDDLIDVFKLECSCIMPLLKMRRRGVRIDMDRLEELEADFRRREYEAYSDVKHITDATIGPEDIWRARELSGLLQRQGVELQKTETGEWQVDRETLSGAGALGRAILTAREMNKLRTTFGQSVRNHMVKGRLHCTFNQMAREREDGKGTLGVRFGRMSCMNPNLQQQPARGAMAKEWRSIYIPEPDSLWASCDWSQQEPRWTTYFAAAGNYRGALDAAQKYIDDPNLDNHDFMAKLTGLDRKAAKAIFLGLCYGQGGAKLCDQLGLPTKMVERYGREFRAAGDEGQKILDTFDKRAPYIRKLSHELRDTASAFGYVQTIGGRKLRFPKKQGGRGYDFGHKALNRLIQGSAADQAKAALAELDRQGFALMLQVHDEFALSVTGEAQAEQAAHIMRTVHMGFPLVKRLTEGKEKTKIAAQIPFKVDVELGESWGAAV